MPQNSSILKQKNVFRETFRNNVLNLTFAESCCHIIQNVQYIMLLNVTCVQTLLTKNVGPPTETPNFSIFWQTQNKKFVLGFFIFGVQSKVTKPLNSTHQHKCKLIFEGMLDISS